VDKDFKKPLHKKYFPLKKIFKSLLIHCTKLQFYWMLYATGKRLAAGVVPNINSTAKHLSIYQKSKEETALIALAQSILKLYL
jgi:hypothetical protein